MFISGAYENTIVQLVKLFKTRQVSQFYTDIALHMNMMHLNAFDIALLI